MLGSKLEDTVIYDNDFFGDLDVWYCSYIQLAITMCELALFQAEVLNAASWALVSWQYQNGAGF
jgi:hypothetical protein